MLLRSIPVFLFFICAIPGLCQASTPPVQVPPLKGKTVLLRMEEAQTWIQKKISGVPPSSYSRIDTEYLQILFFLESHLETLKMTAFKCDHQKLELENCVERSLPRGARPEELEAPYLEALKNLFSSLCPKNS